MGSDPILLRVTLPFLAGYLVSYIYRQVNAVIGPDIARELCLSAAGLGLFPGTYFFTFSLLQLPLGVLLDRYGPRFFNATALTVIYTRCLRDALPIFSYVFRQVNALIGLGVSGC